MPTLTKNRKTKRTKSQAAPAKPAAKEALCAKCGEPLFIAEGAAPRCRICEPLTGTYKIGADGRLSRVSSDIPNVSGSGEAAGSDASCGEGACGMPAPGGMGHCGSGGGCC